MLGSQNKLISQKDMKRRQDYVLYWHQLKGTKLLSVKCLECDVVPFGEKPEDQLSSHFALSAEMGIWL